jgi:hypothetical protein
MLFVTALVKVAQWGILLNEALIKIRDNLSPHQYHHGYWPVNKNIRYAYQKRALCSQRFFAALFLQNIFIIKYTCMPVAGLQQAPVGGRAK